MKRDEINRRVDRRRRYPAHSSELLERKPRQLSGGQRQRVAIGRAIVRDPKLFLLDEPLSNLDAGLRVTMRVELSALHARLGATMIYVTHDQVEAMTLSDRVVVLDKGKVSQFGTPLELFYQPANLFVAGFIGSPRMNFVEADGRVGRTPSVLPCRVAVSKRAIRLRRRIRCRRLTVGSKATLGIRPDKIEIVTGQPKANLSGTVRLVERLGTESHVHIESR